MFNNKIKTVGKWEIFANEDKTELMFTNGLTCAYAYLDCKDANYFFRFDRTVVPKTVVNKALSWAKNNMISIYA